MIKDLRRFVDALPRGLRRQKLLIGLYRSGLVDPVQLLDFDGGARAWVDLRDAESRANYLSQTFWPEFPPIVAAFLRQGGELFDVGANFGLVTWGALPLLRGCGAGYHLFEANPRIVPLLLRSATLWPDERIAVNRCCVSDHPGSSRLVVGDSSWGHAAIAAAGASGAAGGGDAAGGESALAPNLVLDDYIAERRVERVAFMKMDVNGWEPFALRGAARALAAGKVEAAFVEVAAKELAPVGETAAGLLDLMAGYGFDPYFCGLWDTPDPHGLAWARVPVHGTPLRFARAAPLPPTYVQGDVLFVHRTTSLAASLRRTWTQ